MTEEEQRQFWSEFHAKRRERKRRNDELFGPGHERRAAQVRRVLTGRPIIEAVSGAAQAITSFVSATAAYTRDLLEGFNFVKAEQSAIEPEIMQKVREQLAAELHRLHPGRDTIIDPSTMYAVVPVSNASIQAGTYINQPHREIIAAAQYGFKDENELRTLLTELDRPDGEAKATEIFIRATAQFVLSDLAEHDPEAGNLAAFALALKDMRPDIATPEMFDELERRLSQFTGRDVAEIKNVLQPIRETHALEALMAGYSSFGGVEIDTRSTLVPGSDEANAALLDGFNQLPIADGGLAAYTSTPASRPVPPKPDPKDPSRNP